MRVDRRRGVTDEIRPALHIDLIVLAVVLHGIQRSLERSGIANAKNRGVCGREQKQNCDRHEPAPCRGYPA